PCPAQMLWAPLPLPVVAPNDVLRLAAASTTPIARPARPQQRPLAASLTRQTSASSYGASKSGGFRTPTEPNYGATSMPKRGGGALRAPKISTKVNPVSGARARSVTTGRAAARIAAMPSAALHGGGGNEQRPSPPLADESGDNAC